MVTEMDDQTVRVARERHWDASDASDFEVEHEIYREGERIRGRHYIHASSQTRRVLRSGELSAAAISLSLNSY